MADDDLNLQAKQEEMELALRSIGVYVESACWHDPLGEARAMVEQSGEMTEEQIEERFGGKKAYVLAVECFVGDVAFSDRVQNPDQFSVDDEFKAIAREFGDQAFKDAQAKIQQAIAEGRDPFAGEDDL
jgi:hypothetical protein